MLFDILDQNIMVKVLIFPDNKVFLNITQEIVIKVVWTK